MSTGAGLGKSRFSGPMQPVRRSCSWELAHETRTPHLYWVQAPQADSSIYRMVRTCRDPLL